VRLTGNAMENPQDYPELMRIIRVISAENPLQRKRINAFISRQDVDYWTFAEELSRTLNSSFLRDDQMRVEAGRSYNQMCMDILREQIRFRKTGTYLLDDAHLANETVYSQKSVMRYYMVGLLLSYLFWPNHFQMFSFFKDHLREIRVERCLEVGVGHALFTVEMMRRFSNSEITLVDISPTSIELAKEMLATFRLDSSRVRFVLGDYLKVSLDADQFDFIIMGEVLEHVNDAPGFLVRARQLLRPGGTVFLSTCANCPAVDHVYHFHNVDEIRALIRSVGLSIVRDTALPAEDVPEAKWQDQLVTINYSAILSLG
jgi:2-polyprenyl-3-methyl-5-hydroxy-6-metoxy-1,4-benzoquinol methylase